MTGPTAPTETAAEHEVSDAQRLATVLEAHAPRKDELIPILQSVQEEFGYLPKESLTGVSRHIRVSEAHVYGVASFYSQFRFTPVGRNMIMVCRGTACYVKGAPNILEDIETLLDIEEGETTEDMEHSLESVACIGCCALAPCITINGEVHGRLARASVGKLIK